MKTPFSEMIDQITKPTEAGLWLESITPIIERQKREEREQMLVNCALLKSVIADIADDYPATAASLAGIEDYLRSCVEQDQTEATVESRPSYVPKG